MAAPVSPSAWLLHMPAAMVCARRQRALPVAPLLFVVLLLSTSAADGGRRSAASQPGGNEGVNEGVPIRGSWSFAGAWRSRVTAAPPTKAVDRCASGARGRFAVCCALRTTLTRLV